jgi:hypothetical protein
MLTSCLSQHSGLFGASCRHCCRTAVGPHRIQGFRQRFSVKGCGLRLPVAALPPNCRSRANGGHCASPPIFAQDVLQAKSLLILTLPRSPSKLHSTLWRRDESRKSPHPAPEIVANSRPRGHPAGHFAGPVRHRPHSQLGGQQRQCANSAPSRTRPRCPGARLAA